MKLSSTQTNKESLFRFGEEAVALIIGRNFSALAERFGYSLSFGRRPAQAIEEDFKKCLSEAEKTSGQGQNSPSISVKYFKPNNVSLYAVVECIIPITQSATILVELVITSNGDEKHITLEQISNVT